jgi:hypothetical protein
MSKPLLRPAHAGMRASVKVGAAYDVAGRQRILARASSVAAELSFAEFSIDR